MRIDITKRRGINGERSTIGSISQQTDGKSIIFNFRLIIGKNDFISRNMIRDLLCMIKSFLESNGFGLGKKRKNS